MKKLIVLAILLFASLSWGQGIGPGGGMIGGGGSLSVTDITGQTDDSTPAATATGVFAQGGSLIEATIRQVIDGAMTSPGTANVVAGPNAGPLLEAGSGYNTIYGEGAGNKATTIQNAVCVGYRSCEEATVTPYLTCVGTNACNDTNNATGHDVVMGTAAAFYKTNLANSVVIGDNAAQGNASDGTDGQYLTIIGSLAAENHKSANYLLVAGYAAAQNITSADRGIFLGPYAGDSATSETDLIMLGYDANALTLGENYALNIGNLIYGNTNTKDIYILDIGTLGSESLNETDFATHANWDVTGDFTDSTGAAVYTHSAGSGTLTQTSGNLAITLKGNRWYVLEYDISAVTGTPTATIPATTVAVSAASLVISNGTDKKVYFQTVASPTNFVINGASTTATHTFTLDNISLKEVQGGDLHTGGRFYAFNGTGAAPAYSFGEGTGTGMWKTPGEATLNFSAGGNTVLSVTGSRVNINSSWPLAWGGEDFLFRDAANTLGVRRDANQQTVNIYNTYTDGTNYERLAITGVQGASLKLIAQTAGTGGDNLDIILTPAGTGMVALGATQSPASNAACTAGGFTWDASYIYLCTATGAVKRVAVTGGY